MENELSDEEAAAARVETVPTLPPGYTTGLDEHKMGWNAFKNGQVLRRKKRIGSDSPGQPMWFKEEDMAVRYALKHAELALESYEEVPKDKLS